jgi:acyl-CoA synthetase (NDP forming)
MANNTASHPLSDELKELGTLFRSRAVILYGASDRSPWTRTVIYSTRASGFTGQMYAVNLRGVEVLGLPGYVSATQVPTGADVAFVMVPIEAVSAAFADIAAAGIKTAVLLTSGFAETGEEGQQQQDKLVALAREHGIRFMGPNSLGFAHYSHGTALTSVPPVSPLLPHGRVALISQSGAISAEIMEFAHQQGIALSFVAATGNEAMVDIAAVMDYLIEDSQTRVIAAFAETIRNPQRFLAVAARAAAKRKPIVILKVGASELSAAVAMAHTGSLVGDDRAFDAVCAQYGVVRAYSIEDLITTAGLLAHTGVLEKPGVAVVSLSGGACGLISDAAEKYGVNVPPFGDDTVQALKAVQSSYGAIINPFDITGAAVGDPTMFEKCLDVIGRDPAVGLTLCVVPLANEPERVAMSQRLYEPIGRSLARLGPKGLLLNSGLRAINATAREAMTTSGIPAAFGGIDNVLRAIGHVVQWSAFARQGLAAAQRAASITTERPVGEREVLEYLGRYGVPVISARLAVSASEAIEAARQIGGKVVLKIASADIAHKTEVGGVRLNLEGDTAVFKAYTDIMAACRGARPQAKIDGVIVSPMRSEGLELIVGVARDPQWGAMLVIGLGGVFVEVLKDSVLKPLPVTSEDVVSMLNSLNGAALLRGFRGAPAADLETVARVVVAIGHAALSLGPDLNALEVNPLRVNGREVECLDGLVVWSDACASP